MPIYLIIEEIRSLYYIANRRSVSRVVDNVTAFKPQALISGLMPTALLFVIIESVNLAAMCKSLLAIDFEGAFAFPRPPFSAGMACGG